MCFLDVIETVHLSWEGWGSSVLKFLGIRGRKKEREEEGKGSRRRGEKKEEVQL